MIPMKKVLLFLFAVLLLIACGGDDAGDGPSGGSEYLNVSDIAISTGNTTATMYIKASANCEWTITCAESWVTFSEKSGRGDWNVTITVTANPSTTTSREAQVTVSSKTVSRTVTITQAPNYSELIDNISNPQIVEIDKHSVKISFEYVFKQAVSSYGLCYSTSGDPTIDSPHISEQTSSSTGTPSMEITGLSSITSYYVRAYVIVLGVVHYSATTQFTTLSSQPEGGDNVTPDYN